VLAAPERCRIQLKDAVCASGANAIDYRLRDGKRFTTYRNESCDTRHISDRKKIA
jgi:hypothetical protein